MKKTLIRLISSEAKALATMFPLAAALLLLTACSAEGLEAVPGGGTDLANGSIGSAIAFSVLQDPDDDSSAKTRTAKNTITVEGSGTNEASLKTTGFGVFASYTKIHKYSESTVKSDFMYNDNVSWNSTDNAWEYSPLRYWPNGEGEAEGGTADNPHYVSFFAYAPYSDGDGSDPANNPAGYCIPSFSYSHENGDPWIIYRLIPQANIDKQVDLVYAKNLDETRQVTNVPVQFDFKHALACFGDQITIGFEQTDPDDKGTPKEALERLPDVEVKLTDVHIDYTLVNKAKLVLWNNGEPYWQPILSEQMSAERTVTLLPNSSQTDFTIFKRENKVTGTNTSWESPDLGFGLFFIPITIDGYPQKATITVGYDVYVSGLKDEKMSLTKTREIDLDAYYDDFKAGGYGKNKVNITLTWDDPE